MFKNLLVAYDGSEPADRAFDCAYTVARRFGARIEVIYVVQTPRFANSAELGVAPCELVRPARIDYPTGTNCGDGFLPELPQRLMTPTEPVGLGPARWV